MSHPSNAAVFGIYASPAALEAVLDRLRAKGVPSADVSVVSVQAPPPVVEAPLKEIVPVDGPSAGSTAVAAVSGALGWLVGLTALAMAGSVFMVAGPLMAVFARMGEADGTVAAALTDIGVPAKDAEHYDVRIRSGGTLLSVHAPSQEWVVEGRHILEETGAEAVTWIVASEPTSAGDA